jgi:hypothetical protein
LGSSNRLDQADLLNEEIQTDELQELLSRLAATEALFSEPIPTIRDVAEATDASPLLIGRILSQMRGPDQVAELKGRMDGFEARLRELELQGSQKAEGISSSRRHSVPEDFEPIDFNRLLAESGAGDFEPDLGWCAQKKLLERDLSTTLNWHDNETAHRVGRMVVGILFGFMIVVVLLSAGPECGLSQSTENRPVPPPIERSTR